MAINYHVCEQLRIISQTKINICREEIIKNCPKCLNRIGCIKCDLKSKLFDRYVGANIPLDFFDRSMDHFDGDKKLLKLYEEIIYDLRSSFLKGASYCLRGQHGVGKTMFASLLLKKIVEKGMCGLYTTLGDIVNVLIYGDRSVKFAANRELKIIDWLVIDEFDSRFMGNDTSAELFGRVLESIIRIRFQNSMPTILITNNPDPTKMLGEQLGSSISSLIAGHCVDVPVIGRDYRKQIGDK